MRLGTAIALELAVAAGAVYGVWFGVGVMAERAGDYVAPAAEAATYATPTRLPRSHLAVAWVEKKNIFGKTDAEMLAPLGDGTVTKIKLNRGGTSLSLRLDFSNGTRASFKPEQTFPQSDPRREIAAYRIDRLLDIGHVAPCKPVAIPYKELVDAAEPSHRSYVIERLEDAIVRDGIVYGELQWWIPEIKRASIARKWIDDSEGREVWVPLLQAGAQIPAEHRAFLAQLSTLIVFDVLIDNADRWSGNNTTMSPDGSTLFFMDNTLSFSIHRIGHQIPNTALRRIQVFPRGLVERMRALSIEQLEAVLDMGEDQRLGRLLSPEAVRAILARRDNILVYVDRLIAEHGEEAVLAFP